MCSTHYLRWRQANPCIRVHLLNEDTVEDLLPGRVMDLTEKTGLGLRHIVKILARLHSNERARIGRWEPPRCKGSRFTPVWVAGKGTHARKPGKKMRQEHSAAAVREYEARRNGSYQPPPVASWMGPLGALMGE